MTVDDRPAPSEKETFRPEQVRTPWDAYLFAAALLATGATMLYNDVGLLEQGFDEGTGLLGFAMALVILAAAFIISGAMVALRKLPGVPAAMGASALTILAVSSWFLYDFIGGASAESPGCFHAVLALVSLWLFAYAFVRMDAWIRCGGWEVSARRPVPEDKAGPPCPKCGRRTSRELAKCTFCGKDLGDGRE